MDNYLNNMTDVDAEYKIVLAGDSTIGKTTLFKKITKGVFNNLYISTIGFDKKSFDYEITVQENGKESKKNVKMILYDTAGQERYSSVTKTYFKKANGVLLLYSIIDKKTFDHLSKWLNDIKDKLGNIEDNRYLVFLIGTKFDLVKNDENLRQVTEEEALDFCEKNNLLWYGEYSSKETDQETFQKLFTEFAKKIYEKVGYNKMDRETVSTITSKKTKKQRRHCAC